MSRKPKSKILGNHFKCSACIKLVDGFRKSPCELYSKDLMVSPTICVWGPFNSGDNYTRAKWNRVKK